MHRSPDLWENPDEFDPDRWTRTFKNPEVVGWKGRSAVTNETLFPNEVISDFAFLPFGGGSRKCVGDQFAMLESIVAFAVTIRDFDMELLDPPEEIERDLVTGATIHTKNGLNLRVKPRNKTASKREIKVRSTSTTSKHHGVELDEAARAAAVEA
mmetsp:Transcript_10282/g.31437  ORF Transcript_10282/g.31437 Transcript_10282/m.31437 type:complete len:155 (+) Transcript_10282:273-737(+)